MRINQFVAAASGYSRRKADHLIAEGRVKIDNHLASTGQQVIKSQLVTLDSTILKLSPRKTIMLNKPVGYVVSRSGQGAKTIYTLLPKTYSELKPVGRLDKDSSGLLIMTSDGQLAHRLTHPSKMKLKVYSVKLDRPLSPEHQHKLSEAGVILDDGQSKIAIAATSDQEYIITMHEGRNRQIRRSFSALGYEVVYLHRTRFGDYCLDGLKEGNYREIVT